MVDVRATSRRGGAHEEGQPQVLMDRSYRRAPVARAAARLARAVYGLVSYFPDDEKSGLTATLKKTVTAIPARLADGAMKDDPDEAARVLHATVVSLRELAGYLNTAQYLRMTSRWRFRLPLRRANTLHNRICDLLDAIDAYKRSPQYQLSP
jgi:four helix bundle protein